MEDYRVKKETYYSRALHFYRLCTQKYPRQILMLLLLLIAIGIIIYYKTQIKRLIRENAHLQESIDEIMAGKNITGPACFNCSVPWSPGVINMNCPVFVKMTNTYNGFGDQIEQYIFGLNIAKKIGATLVIENAFNGTRESFHDGGNVYAYAAELMGIKYHVSPIALQNINIIEEKPVSYLDFTIMAEQIHKREYNPCYRVFRASIYSCGPNRNDWCHHLPEIKTFTGFQWVLRNNQFPQKCAKHVDAIYKHTPHHINVVWHIRNGDICVRCNDANYFRNTLTTLDLVLKGYKYKIYLLSPFEIKLLKSTNIIPSYQFRKYSFIDTICMMATGDIVIASGSSFPVGIVAFTPFHHPIIFEDSRKETIFGSKFQARTHHYNTGVAVLLRDGELIANTVFEVRSLVQSYIITKKNISLAV